MEETSNFVYVVTHKGYPLATPIESIARAHAEAITELTGDEAEVQKIPIVVNERGASSALIAMLMTEALVGGL